MFCKYCGYEYQNDDAVFCPSCGKKLKEESIAINNSNTVTNQPKVTYYNLGPLCMQYGHKSKYCDFGCPIDPVTISKHAKLIEAMKINNNEQIYYLHHEYLFNSLTTGLLHGFAICGSGIYIYGSSNGSESCYIPWDIFKLTGLKFNWSEMEFTIGNYIIETSDFIDMKHVSDLFKAIKSSI